MLCNVFRLTIYNTLNSVMQKSIVLEPSMVFGLILWLYQLVGMEAAGGGSSEISARLRDWCAVRAPDDLKRAADTAHRARKKYDKVTLPFCTEKALLT